MLEAKFCLQTGGWPVVDQHAEGFGRGRAGDLDHVVCAHVMTFCNLDDRIDCSLRAVRARISLERNAGLQEPESLAKLLARLFLFQCAEEAALLIENIRIARKSHGRKLGRHDAVSRCVARCKGFTIVPKFWLKPAVKDAAIPSAT